jgi:bacterioferritin-associated ferredoxin
MLPTVTTDIEARMYICLCNAIRDRDLHPHTAGGCCSVSMVYRALGAEPKCGKCVPFVRQALRQAADAAMSAQSATPA